MQLFLFPAPIRMTPPRAPLQELPVNVRRQSQLKKRVGPRPKPLKARVTPKRVDPIKEIHQTYSRERKIELLCFLEHYRVYDLRPQEVTSRIRIREGGIAFERDQD